MWPAYRRAMASRLGEVKRALPPVWPMLRFPLTTGVVTSRGHEYLRSVRPFSCWFVMVAYAARIVVFARVARDLTVRVVWAYID